jgi:hypothetical protein
MGAKLEPQLQRLFAALLPSAAVQLFFIGFERRGRIHGFDRAIASPRFDGGITAVCALDISRTEPRCL